MKKVITILSCCLLLTILTYPALGVTNSSLDRRLTNLSNRFSNLESTWGRFQIGGNFKLDSTSSVNTESEKLSSLEYNQELHIFLNAYVDPTVQFSLNLAQVGNWGAYYPSTILPFQVDEAFLKVNSFGTLDYLGRFRFSLGPLGILSDFYNNPAEGIAIQKEFNNHYHIVAVYSRVYTEYDPDTSKLNQTYDYFVTRLGWSNKTTLVGLNLVPKGGANEQGISIDWSTNTNDTKLAAEVGLFSQNPGQTEWSPGAIISYGKNIGANSFLQLKAGYIAPGFAPYYSSLSRSFLDNREWFIPDSKGIEIFLHNDLKKGFGLDNRLIVFNPVQSSQSDDLLYRFKSSLIKNFSPVNQLQLGIDLKSYPDEDLDKQIFASWFIQF